MTWKLARSPLAFAGTRSSSFHSTTKSPPAVARVRTDPPGRTARSSHQAKTASFGGCVSGIGRFAPNPAIAPAPPKTRNPLLFTRTVVFAAPKKLNGAESGRAPDPLSFAPVPHRSTDAGFEATLTKGVALGA